MSKKYLIILLLFSFAGVYAQEPMKDSATGKYYFEKETEKGMVRINNILYDEVTTFYAKYALAKHDGKWYMVDQNLKNMRGPFDYADREAFDNNGEAAVRLNGKWNVLSYKNKLLLKRSVPDSNFFYNQSETFYFQSVNNRVYRAIIKKRKWVELSCTSDSTPGEGITNEYCELEDFLNFSGENLAAVKKEKYGYVNKKGVTILPFIFDYAGDFNYKAAVVKKDGMYGYVDASLNLFIPFMFDNAKPFIVSAAAVQKGFWYGLINKQRMTIVPFDYSDLNCIDQNGLLYSAKKNSTFGIIDSNNHTVIPFDYEADFGMINSNCFVAKRDGYFGLINIVQRKLVPFNYKEYDLSLKSKNLIVFKVKEDTKNPYQIFNTFGDKRNDEGYQTVYYFYGDRCQVKRNEKYGLIDESGYEVVPCQYDAIGYLNTEGTYQVTKGIEKFFIDKTGQKVVRK
ncbi:MAG: WG repeat-containing protein [Bacteroidota bacterium]|nr:WG repeat-containing protein [Bacteroidota bacterium]